MPTPTVSVILPPGSARCLASLKEQTFRDVEILTEADSLEKAQGLYLLFPEPEDYFDPTFLEKVVTAAKAHEADLVLFGAQDYNPRTEAVDPLLRHLSQLPSQPVFTPQEAGANLFSLIDPEPWLCLFRADFLREKRLLSLPRDLRLIPLALAEARRICALREGLVFHRKENSSTPFPGDALIFLTRELSARGFFPELRKPFVAFALNALHGYFPLSLSLTDRRQGLDFLAVDAPELQELLQEGSDSVAENLNALRAWWLRRHNQLRPKTPEAVHLPPEGKAPLLSVVVPMYNTEKYLRETLDSLTRQSFTDLEILLIDDGSTDNTLALAKELALADPRLRIWHQENSGSSAARNVGLKHARGKYLHFMDSDDRLAPDTYAKLIARMEAEALDLLFFNGESFLSDPGLVPLPYGRSREYAGVHTGPQMMQKLHAHGDYICQPSMYLTRRDFLKEQGLSFLPGIIHQDILFTFTLFLYAQRVGHLHETLYQRRMRAGSIVTSPRSFADVYAYLTIFMEMQRLLAAREGALSPDEYTAFISREEVLLRTMIQTYAQLSPQQQYCRHSLGKERGLLNALLSGLSQPQSKPVPVSKRQALATLFPFTVKVKHFLNRLTSPK